MTKFVVFVYYNKIVNKGGFMEIKELRFKNHVWGCMNQGATICICKNGNCNYTVSYEKNGKKLECQLIENKAQELEKKLNSLNIHTWEIDVVFVDNEEKNIQGFNGYPKNWKQFLYLYYWVAQCCNETEVVDVSKPINTDNMTAYDEWELDKKFELLDKETILQMTGTGSGLKRKN